MRSIVVWVWVCAFLLISFKANASEERLEWLQKQSKDVDELRIENRAFSDYFAPGSSGSLVIEVDNTCQSGGMSPRLAPVG